MWEMLYIDSSCKTLTVRVSEKKLVKNMTYLMWGLNPQLSVDEADTLPNELKCK